MMKDPKKDPQRYPPFWEKIIPYLLGLIALAILALLVVALSVVFGCFPTF